LASAAESVKRRPKEAPNAIAYLDGDRDLRLDACRGLALWFIFIDHIPGNAFEWMTLRNYGFSDASEVFVFVSGYTCMLAYGGALRSQGWPTVIIRSLRRSLEIYAAFLLLVVIYLALIWLSGSYRDETNTSFFFESPGATLVHLLALQYTPVNTDILPTFVMLHLMFPLVLWATICNAGIGLAVSFLLYVMVQIYGWHLPAWPSGELYFNPLAWQFLFVIGACSAAGACSAQFAAMLRHRVTVLFASVFLVFTLVIALSWRVEAFRWIVPEIVEGYIYPIHKSHLAPLRLVHFLALVVIVTRIAPSDRYSLPRPWVTAMIRCGENSLPVYSFSVLASFVGFVALSAVSGGLAMQAAVSLSGIVLMIVVANLLTWEARLDRRGPKLF
jgi:hypothetical protein